MQKQNSQATLALPVLVCEDVATPSSGSGGASPLPQWLQGMQNAFVIYVRYNTYELQRKNRRSQ